MILKMMFCYKPDAIQWYYYYYYYCIDHKNVTKTLAEFKTLCRRSFSDAQEVFAEIAAFSVNSKRNRVVSMNTDSYCTHQGRTTAHRT